MTYETTTDPSTTTIENQTENPTTQQTITIEIVQQPDSDADDHDNVDDIDEDDDDEEEDC